MQAEGIHIENLSVGYVGSRRRHIVASGIGGTIVAGSLTCLLGANGVGKSTLLRTLAAFQPPLEGKILMDGQDLTAWTRRELARKVTVVLTMRPQVQHLTVSGLVAMGRAPYTGFWGRLATADRLAVEQAMKAVGMEGYAHKRVVQLSDGELQKTMIAKALAQETPVILMDEPTAFLDFRARADVMCMLGRLAHEQKKTIFLSTHDVQMAVQTADWLWLMDATETCQGTPSSLAASGVLRQFLGSAADSMDIP